VARSRRSSHNLLWCRVWCTCQCWPNRRRRCRRRDRNGMISRSPMRRSIISANRRREGRRRCQKSGVSPAPLWHDRFSNSQRRDRMTDQLTILSFGFTKPLRWHGWVMTIGYTRLMIELIWWWRWCGVELRAVEQIVHASLSKKTRAQSEKVSTNFGEINTQTAVEEFEYSFLWTYLVEFSETCAKN
jgi:hypothetical protein